jgi:hypothetical protein
MAQAAITGHGMVSAQQWIDSVVIKRRGNPGALAMTLLAVGWKLCCLMIRICGNIIIIQVAAHTRLWGIIITSRMTEIAIMSNRLMSTLQRINGAVIKIGRYPGCFIMTLFTICGKLSQFVIGVCGGVVVTQVTSGTGIGRVGISIGMTKHTIGGYGLMPSY